jgi:hypothetical protein
MNLNTIIQPDEYYTPRQTYRHYRNHHHDLTKNHQDFNIIELDRRRRNTESARRCRKRRQDEFTSLKLKISELECEIMILKSLNPL